ncbi:beta-prism lectin domain-containing protein [Vibrio sinaloensis]|uniref:beta-prism lectin domain-containing protein n=1 Tax=Photobacterium sp. (strain ATCC 43367) TaxID=379097 RepID=UPI00057FEF22|nr:beta-prism lectin domain-containing protein [Vibrio sinaloensis]KHT50123.1 hemolysin [Vibrio sinaloensis]
MEHKYISLTAVLISLNSMTVFASAEEGVGCIVSKETGDKYCLNVGERSGYSLPSFIYEHEVDVYAGAGAGVMLSDWDNLSYNRLAVFTGYTPNSELEAVKAYNGKVLDFSAPRSMRVVSRSPEVEPVLAWSWQGSSFMPEYDQVMVSPVVVQLNDDNNDGKIDSKDTADIIVITFKDNQYKSGGLIRALSGVDGSELWNYDNGGVIADARYSVSAADLDGDGIVEIVSSSLDDSFISILDHNGNVKKKIDKFAPGWSTIGQFSLADLDKDGSVEIVAPDGVYNYDTGLLVYSYTWASAPITVDVDNDGQEEVFAAKSIFDTDGSSLWTYQSNDRVWFSSVANLDIDNAPEIIVSTPANRSDAQNSSFAVLEHDGTTKWSVTNLNNPGGGVQAVSNFLGKPIETEVDVSDLFGFEYGKKKRLELDSEGLLYVNSGLAIDAVGTEPQKLFGGNGGHSNSPVVLNNVLKVAITSGKYYWGGKHLLALKFYMNDGSTKTFGSTKAAVWKQTEYFKVPQDKAISAVNVWSDGWLVEAIQFELIEEREVQTTGIVYAGHYAVDMYDRDGNLVWSVPNDDSTSGKIGVSAYDFDGDGIDEVITQDQRRVRILDGRSGLVLNEITNSTATLWESPVVADLAGDNNAELIVVANDYDSRYSFNRGVYVFKSADLNKPWKNATRIWNQHSFHQSNITQEGAIPSKYEPSWLTHNTYRSSTLPTKKGTGTDIIGFPTGKPTNVDLDDELYVRSGWMIDALGEDDDEMVGGPGGVLGIPVDLEKVAKIEVTSGTFYWGGNHIVALTFTYHDGTVLFYGSKHYAHSQKTDVVEIPSGEELEEINVWSSGQYVDAVQFILD